MNHANLRLHFETLAMNYQLFDQIKDLDFPAPLPEKLLVVKQRFDVPRVADIEASTRAAVRELMLGARPGATVAIGAGSRGIANIARIARAAVDVLKADGFHPYIFPAMGSHGGATMEGQCTMIREFGITAETMGCELRATMVVREIGHIEGGPKLYQGEDSLSADHVILLSRIKPHTDFRGMLESGPSKMAVIGLGKQAGAAIMHSYGGPGFTRYLADAARVYESNTNFIGAVGIIENAYDETAEIMAVPANKVGTDVESEALKRARSYMASIPFTHVDTLVIQAIGKNISGTGMDTNIINRLMVVREPEPTSGPDVATISVLDLTPETHGNASGIGMANSTTERVARKYDFIATYTNGLTSGTFGAFRSSLPIVATTDQRAIQYAIRGCGQPWETARLMFIRNTLAMDEFWTSPSLRTEIEGHERLSIVGETPLTFMNGLMTCPWQLK